MHWRTGLHPHESMFVIAFMVHEISPSLVEINFPLKQIRMLDAVVHGGYESSRLAHTEFKCFTPHVC